VSIKGSEGPVNAYDMSLDCLVQENTSPVDFSKWNIPPTLLLVDPKFHKPGKIDLLIGADGFWKLICSGRITLSSGGAVLQETKLGWIVVGKIQETLPTRNRTIVCKLNIIERIDTQLKKFWEIEEPPHDIIYGGRCKVREAFRTKCKAF
jgi:hypothetical protein